MLYVLPLGPGSPGPRSQQTPLWLNVGRAFTSFHPCFLLVHCLRGTGAFPPCIPAVGILHNSGKATRSFLPVLLLIEPPKQRQRWDKSQLRAQGFLKALLRGGAVPAIYRDRESHSKLRVPRTELGLLPGSCHPGRWSPPSLPLSPPPPTLHLSAIPCLSSVLRGRSVQSLLEEAKAKHKALAHS